MTEGLQMASLAARQLRWAELNEMWEYMASLLATLKAMGARVMRVPDPAFKWRADYLVEFRRENTIPGTF